MKLIICPKMEAVSYINKNREFRTYKLSALSKYGCTVDLYERLKYAVNIVDQLQKKLVEEKNARLLKRDGACWRQILLLNSKQSWTCSAPKIKSSYFKYCNFKNLNLQKFRT